MRGRLSFPSQRPRQFVDLITPPLPPHPRLTKTLTSLSTTRLACTALRGNRGCCVKQPADSHYATNASSQLRATNSPSATCSTAQPSTTTTITQTACHIRPDSSSLISKSCVIPCTRRSQPVTTVSLSLEISPPPRHPPPPFRPSITFQPPPSLLPLPQPLQRPLTPRRASPLR